MSKEVRYMRLRSGILLMVVTALAFGAAGLYAGGHFPGEVGAQKKQDRFWKENELQAQAGGGQERLMSFSGLVKKATPAVVNISFEKTVSFIPRGMPFGQGGNDPFGDFFERFFGPMPKEYKNKGLGTGFVISEDGYIVTNNHVIEQADRIVVKLMDDEKEYQARVIGRDSKTDIALVKIDAGKNLPVLPLGDSDKMEVGDWVVAIGNPLGLSHTVTKGIISFKGRKDIRPSGHPGYYDFIQTDAPINPGNSGGPLINIDGEVIGVNESMVGGAQNIGFAVPINMAKAIISSLKDHGRVVRSWLGVQIQPVTQNLAESFGLSKTEGALIADVVAGGPADKAGLKTGDIIIEFNGKKISRSEDLPWLASNAGIGREAGVKIIRDGKPKELKVTLGEMPEDGKFGKGVGPGKGGEEIGMAVRAVPPEISERAGLRPGKGVLVVSVKEGSKAAEAGIAIEDIILKVNDQETNNPVEFVRVVKSVKSGALVRMLVRRGEGNIFVAFKKD
jgi:serine protease Do